MYYKLIRHTHKGKSVHGTLYRVQHRFSQHAGQYKEYLTRICETLEHADYLVLPLIYKIEVTQSPRFKRLLPILLQVPGRTGIRWHRGTKPQHSKGCILVSEADEKRITALWLKEQRAKEETRLEITNIEIMNN